jgi:hypothetical protein
VELISVFLFRLGYKLPTGLAVDFVKHTSIARTVQLAGACCDIPNRDQKTNNQGSERFQHTQISPP